MKNHLTSYCAVDYELLFPNQNYKVTGISEWKLYVGENYPNQNYRIWAIFRMKTLGFPNQNFISSE